MHQGKFWDSVSCPRTPELKTEGVLKHRLPLCNISLFDGFLEVLLWEKDRFTGLYTKYTLIEQLVEQPAITWRNESLYDFRSLMLLCVNVGPLLFTTLAQFAKDSFMHSALKVPPWCFSQVELDLDWTIAATWFFLIRPVWDSLLCLGSMSCWWPSLVPAWAVGQMASPVTAAHVHSVTAAPPCWRLVRGVWQSFHTCLVVF